MLEERMKLADFCREACEKVSGNFYFAGLKPRFDCRLNNYCRFLMCLNGRKHIMFSDGKKIRTLFLETGDVIFVPCSGMEEELWDSPHEMISCILLSSYTRVIHINHDGNGIRPNGPDIFFHIPKDMISGENSIAEAIMELKGNSPDISFRLMQILIDLLAEALRKSPKPSGEETVWMQICEAMHHLFLYDISRIDVAELAEVTPTELSRQVQQHTGKPFRDFLNSHRLEHALILLRQQNLSINEISLASGFSYPSYFIRLFHKRYGVSPEHYRKEHYTFPATGDL